MTIMSFQSASRGSLVLLLAVTVGCANAESEALATTSSGASSSGSGGGGAPPTCGDGRIDVGEECDGAETGPKTCADYGFASGELACSTACRISSIGCFKDEKCAVDIPFDRDGDGLFGCYDEDCFDAPTCTDPCGQVYPPSLLTAAPPGGWTILHLPSGHGAEPDFTSSSCSPAIAGGDRIYPLAFPGQGTLRVMADTTLDGMDLSLSLRTTCETETSEVACHYDPGATTPEMLAAPVEADTAYYLIIEGFIPNTIPSMMLWMAFDPDPTGDGGGGSGTGGMGGAGGSGGGAGGAGGA
ncbi:MAG: hypothetical protein JNL21_08200 [Myxococcales bacterium]|nr:hypothetical protein [Myxococcales bacterium]